LASRGLHSNSTMGFRLQKRFEVRPAKHVRDRKNYSVQKANTNLHREKRHTSV
jgi:hypothetical protein